MRIGIGLPNPVPGTPGNRLVEWAQRAEERGFSGLATIDRIAYPNYDSLISLAAAAAVTSRIGLQTNILLGPIYPAAVLAKAAASIDQISGGRFTLGIAPGGREDDYTVTGRDFRRRGAELDAEVELMRRAWRGEPVAGGRQPITPTPTSGEVPIMFGGSGDKAAQRTARWGVGWTAGGAPPEMAAGIAAKVRDAWSQAGRDGEPRLAALAYFSLGTDAESDSRAYLLDYYEFTGPYAEQIANGALRTPDAIQGAVKGFADAGFTELYFDPTVARLDQIDRLADVVL